MPSKVDSRTAKRNEKESSAPDNKEYDRTEKQKEKKQKRNVQKSKRNGTGSPDEEKSEKKQNPFLCFRARSNALANNQVDRAIVSNAIQCSGVPASGEI